MFRCTHHAKRAYNDGMESNVFDLIDIELAGTTERVLAGGRHLFPLLPRPSQASNA